MNDVTRRVSAFVRDKGFQIKVIVTFSGRNPNDFYNPCSRVGSDPQINGQMRL